MPTFWAVSCYSCKHFQVRQATKSKSFQCCICNEKQSFKQIFFESSVAAECRTHVQELNWRRKDVESAKMEWRMMRATEMYSGENPHNNNREEEVLFGPNCGKRHNREGDTDESSGNAGVGKRPRISKWASYLEPNSQHHEMHHEMHHEIPTRSQWNNITNSQETFVKGEEQARRTTGRTSRTPRENGNSRSSKWTRFMDSKDEADSIVQPLKQNSNHTFQRTTLDPAARQHQRRPPLLLPSDQDSTLQLKSQDPDSRYKNSTQQQAQSQKSSRWSGYLDDSGDVLVNGKTDVEIGQGIDTSSQFRVGTFKNNQLPEKRAFSSSRELPVHHHTSFLAIPPPPPKQHPDITSNHETPNQSPQEEAFTTINLEDDTSLLEIDESVFDVL